MDQGSYAPIRTEDIPPLLATTFFTFATSGESSALGGPENCLKGYEMRLAEVA